MKRVHQFSFLVATLCAAVLPFSGCNSSSQPTRGASATSVDGGGDNALRIAVIPKGTSHEFWKSVHYGAEKAAKDSGSSLFHSESFIVLRLFSLLLRFRHRKNARAVIARPIKVLATQDALG